MKPHDHPGSPATPRVLAWLTPLGPLALALVLDPACATSATGASAGPLPPAGATASAEPVEMDTADNGGAADPAAEQADTLAPPEKNPFRGARFLIDPDYVRKVESTPAASPDQAALFHKAAAYPTAVWLDSIEMAQHASRWLDEARRQQQSAGEPVVTVFVVYDLPGRDCAAAASAGELSPDKAGEARYRKEFIDKIAAQFKAHHDQRIVALIEPDSLGNLATNLNIPRCAAADPVYRRSVAYAISKLSMPNVSVYLDAAHAGWLGWTGNRGAIAQVYKDILDAAGGADTIRGFFTNASNYTALHGRENQKLEPSNPCPDETTYVRELAETLMWAGIKHKGYIIDTSRNGRDGVRSKWGNWCNVRGAGLGERPRAAPTALVDAYYWVKPPGESDGTADATAARFDENCRSSDATPGAPEAGKWFPSFFKELVKNANLPL